MTELDVRLSINTVKRSIIISAAAVLAVVIWIVFFQKTLWSNQEILTVERFIGSLNSREFDHQIKWKLDRGSAKVFYESDGSKKGTYYYIPREALLSPERLKVEWIRHSATAQELFITVYNASGSMKPVLISSAKIEIHPDTAEQGAAVNP